MAISCISRAADIDTPMTLLSRFTTGAFRAKYFDYFDSRRLLKWRAGRQYRLTNKYFGLFFVDNAGIIVGVFTRGIMSHFSENGHGMSL